MSKFMLALIGAATVALSGMAMQAEADARGYRSNKTEAPVIRREGKVQRHATRAAAPERGVVRRSGRSIPTAAQVSKRPGSCGTYMYWKDGKCNDARDKK